MLWVLKRTVSMIVQMFSPNSIGKVGKSIVSYNNRLLIRKKQQKNIICPVISDRLSCSDILFTYIHIHSEFITDKTKMSLVKLKTQSQSDKEITHCTVE